MQVNGRSQRPRRTIHCNSTNGLTKYSAVEWLCPASGDMRWSCNCPGWTIWRDKSKPRTCKHVQALMDNDYSNVEMADDIPSFLEEMTPEEVTEMLPDKAVAKEVLRGIRIRP